MILLLNMKDTPHHSREPSTPFNVHQIVCHDQDPSGVPYYEDWLMRRLSNTGRFECDFPDLQITATPCPGFPLWNCAMIIDRFHDIDLTLSVLKKRCKDAPNALCLSNLKRILPIAFAHLGLIFEQKESFFQGGC